MPIVVGLVASFFGFQFGFYLEQRAPALAALFSGGGNADSLPLASATICFFAGMLITRSLMKKDEDAASGAGDGNDVPKASGSRKGGKRKRLGR